MMVVAYVTADHHTCHNDAVSLPGSQDQGPVNAVPLPGSEDNSAVPLPGSQCQEPVDAVPLPGSS